MTPMEQDSEHRLLSEYLKASRVYALAVTELEQAPAGKFQTQLERVEAARQALDTARGAVDTFRAAHRSANA